MSDIQTSTAWTFASAPSIGDTLRKATEWLTGRRQESGAPTLEAQASADSEPHWQDEHEPLASPLEEFH